MCVCVCVCVCECVFAGKRGPCSDILYPDRGRTTKRGRPRIGEIVLMVANSTCIHMRMCSRENFGACMITITAPTPPEWIVRVPLTMRYIERLHRFTITAPYSLDGFTPLRSLSRNNSSQS